MNVFVIKKETLKKDAEMCFMLDVRMNFLLPKHVFVPQLAERDGGRVME